MKALKFSAIALLTSLSFCVFAGPNDGGGGQGIVCRDANRQITRPVELLDLWEAREIYHRKINYQNDRPVAQRLLEVFDILEHVAAYPYKSTIYNAKGLGSAEKFSTVESFRRRLQDSADIFLNTQETERVARYRGKRLAKTNDAYEDITPDEPGCEVEQIVRYKDHGPNGDVLVMVNQDLVERMDATNQAALWAHESLYAILRKFGEKTSLRVRRAVGYAFSGGTFTPWESLVSHPYIQCDNINMMSDTSSTRTRILMVQSAPDIVGYLFVQVNGMLVMGFEKNNLAGGMGGTVESVYKGLLKGSYGFGNRVFAYSITDFDQIIDFRVTTPMNARQATATVQIVGGPSGVLMSAPQQLTCKLVK